MSRMRKLVHSVYARGLAGVALGALLGIANPAGAQTASLVRDINLGTDSSSSGFPQHLLTAGGKVFFDTGGGVWVSDGTPAGTVLLREQNARLLGNLGSTVFWSVLAEDGISQQLWRSDGTREGTSVLAGPENGIQVLPPDSLGHSVAFFQRRLWFSGCGDGACSLWSTDGTSAGTVKDVDVFHAGPLDLAPAGSHLFFQVQTASGQELWATDGTPGNAALVAELGRFPGAQAAAGGRLFFIPATAAGDLWTSDGTPAGTGPLTHAPSVVSGALVPIGGRVYFGAQKTASGPRDLWVTDGTAAGTRAVTHFTTGGAFMSSTGDLAAAGGRLVFLGIDQPGRRRLFATDGHPESTTRLPDPGVCPGSGCLGLDNSYLVSTGSRVVFRGETPATGGELWSTDGIQGPHLIEDFCPGPCNGVFTTASPSWAGGVLFQAATAVNGRYQIWSTDGTLQGTKRLTAVPDGYGAFLGTDGGFATLGKTLFFIGNSPQGTLWATDGNPASTRLVALEAPGGSSDPRELTPAAGGGFFFAACGTADGRRVWLTHGTADSTVPVLGNAAVKACVPSDLEPLILGTAGGTAIFRSGQNFQELWRTDGTAAGTFSLGQIFVVSRPSTASFAGRLFFPVFPSPSAALSLWASDGTVAGTQVFEDFPDANAITNVTAVGNALYFIVEEQEGRVVWVSDGTAAGTRSLTPPLNAINPVAFTALGSLVFFASDNQIWRTDGTPGGTVPVADVSFPRELAALNGALYFVSGLGQVGDRVLWRTDGTSTVQVLSFPLVPLAAAPDQGYPHGLTAFAGHLFFAAADADHGVELWTSDGTPGGTKMLRDITPGPDSSIPSGFTVAGGRLVFTARDPEHGRELWQTDGTAAGTRLVQDLQPMSGSSLPDSLTVIGDRLYFAADDGLTGRELWSLPVTAPATCQPTASRLCLNGGRFQVEAAWHDFQSRQGTGQAVPLTADTGYFWFFDPANVETVLKVLDGRGVNGHFWTFYGALSNVGYDLTVTDTQTGAARRYSNPLGQFASVGDTHSFGPLGALSPKGDPSATRGKELILAETRIDPAAALTPCQPSATQLCLENNRFTVTAAWKDFQGHQGNGTAVVLTADTGYFWFFDAANVEVVLKVLDGTAVNGHRWVFYGALSNVEYTLTVTDTTTGTSRTYRNPSGRFASFGDTTAF